MTAPDPRLGEIENRLNAATPGPWEVYRNDREVTMWVLSGDGALECYLGYLGNRPENDAEFIAHSPSDVAYLLAELRKRDEVIADAWDEGYERAESDHDGTGFWTKRLRANPYRAAVTGDGA